MVKFIATDLDGTLLNNDRALPEGIFDVVTELYRCGVLFAPASGRQYANLKKLFAPVADKLLFLCENGALVKYKDETIYLNPVSDGDALRAIEEIRKIPHLYPLLCGTQNAYIDDESEPFYGCAVRSYTNCIKVDDVKSVLGRERVCKISVYDEIGSAVNCIQKLPPRLPRLRVILSGAEWCDVSAPDADKGAAIRFIQEKFSFKREECVAFGDHMNDYEMLTECGHAYITENAYPPLKELIGGIIPSNEEGGVLIKLKEILKQIKEERA